jgi:hypothetical protein
LPDVPAFHGIGFMGCRDVLDKAVSLVVERSFELARGGFDVYVSSLKPAAPKRSFGEDERCRRVFSERGLEVYECSGRVEDRGLEFAEYIIATRLSPWGIGVWCVRDLTGERPAHRWYPRELIEESLRRKVKTSQVIEKWLRSPWCTEPEELINKLREELQILRDILSLDERRRLAKAIKKVADETLL